MPIAMMEDGHGLSTLCTRENIDILETCFSEESSLADCGDGLFIAVSFISAFRVPLVMYDANLGMRFGTTDPASAQQHVIRISKKATLT